jgi:putative glycerol-1-phosphate prenyltransferase
LKNIYHQLLNAKNTGKKQFAVLIDPDKLKVSHIDQLIQLSMEGGVDYFLIGGSLIINNMLDDVLSKIRAGCDIPMVLFPGNSFQLSYKADAILFLSLISGRNPELLIGKHVVAAPFLKLSPLEIISCGYMLVDGGKMTTVQYMSNTTPMPRDKPDIAMSTALAGELLGLKLIYLDAGSGASLTVPDQMIEMVSNMIQIPLIVGGGISTPEEVAMKYKAGADLVVVGNAIEKDINMIKEMSIVSRI